MLQDSPIDTLDQTSPLEKPEQSEIQNYNLLENTILTSLDKKINLKDISKRKFVCIEFDEKLKDLVAKKYHYHEFLTAKKNGKNIYLAIYIKENEQDLIFKEAGKFLKLSVNLSNANRENDEYKQDKISKIIEHFKKVYTLSFKKYDSFEALSQAYDRETGEDVSEKLNKMLEETFRKLQEKYTEKEKLYGERALELKSILNEVKIEYTKAIAGHQQFAHNTFLPLEKTFKLLENKFNNEVNRLEEEDKNKELNDRFGALRDTVIVLKDDCKDLCHENGLYSKKIITDHSQITESIDFLSRNLNELENGSFTEDAINGLENKCSELFGKLETLRQSINRLTVPDEANQDAQKGMPEEVGPLFEELALLLKEVTDHKTDATKSELQEKLIKEISSISALQGKNSLEDLTNVINKANEFIESNKVKASAYTAGPFGKFLGKGYSVLGDLMDKLQNLLDRILRVLSSNHSNDEISSNLPSMSFGRA